MFFQVPSFVNFSIPVTRGKGIVWFFPQCNNNFIPHRFIFVRKRPKIWKNMVHINEWITIVFNKTSSIPLMLWRSNSYTCKCIFSQRHLQDMIWDWCIGADVFQSIYFTLLFLRSYDFSKIFKYNLIVIIFVIIYRCNKNVKYLQKY